MPIINKNAVKPEAKRTQKPVVKATAKATKTKQNKSKTRSKVRVLHESDPFF